MNKVVIQFFNNFPHKVINKIKTQDQNTQNKILLSYKISKATADIYSINISKNKYYKTKLYFLIKI